MVVFAGSVPRGWTTTATRDMIEQAARLGLTTFFYTYADPLRLGIKAGPDYVFPKLVEAEKVIGYEFTSRGATASRRPAPCGRWAAGSVVITFRYGCVAELADGEGSRTFVGKMPDGRRGLAAGLGRRAGGRLRGASAGGRLAGRVPALRSGLRRGQPDRATEPACSCRRRGEVGGSWWNWRRCLLKGRVDGVKKVLVIDFGGQYSQLIARRVRECRVYSELVPYDTPVAEIQSRGSGRHHPLRRARAASTTRGAPTVDPEIFALGVPVLGICYGLQLMAKLKGGRVARVDLAEYGGRPLTVTRARALCSPGFPPRWPAG